MVGLEGVVYVALLLGLHNRAGGVASAASPTCADGVFGIQAQVVRIDPPHAVPRKQLRSGGEQPIRVDDPICAGESIVLDQAGPIRSIELYREGRKEVVKPGQPFINRGGVLAYLRDALAFITDVVEGSEGLKSPPDIPGPTAPRGNGINPTVPALPIGAMRFLRDLPRQYLTDNMPPVISWREGVGPYTCEAMTNASVLIWQTRHPETISWCAFDSDLKDAVQLLVRDSRDRSESWNIDRVPWDAVPRPEWIVSAVWGISSADRTAWAFWLWRHAGPRWRLQSLGMLHELTPHEWLAGYVRDNLLAESARFAPR